MRTTLTLSPDLAPQLEAIRKSRGISMARVVNDVIRRGLTLEPARRKSRYSLKTAWRGKSLVGALDNIGELLAIAEGEDHT